MQKTDKLLDQLRFVFLTSFVLCFSMFFLDYMSVLHGRSGITLFLISKPHHDLKPSTLTTNLAETETINDRREKNVNFSDTEPENPTEIQKQEVHLSVNTNLDDPCSGRHIYMHDLPGRFNEDLLKKCRTLMVWTDMCPYMTNSGLGPKITMTDRSSESKVLVLKNTWYATNQFSLEVIFHNKMKNYICLTKNSSMASAIFVPYYAGLDAGQYLWDHSNVSVRDASPKELTKWLSERPEWKKMWGRDHFLIGGRIGWDFRRRTDNDSDWGTKLMFLPEASNMTILPIESGSYDNDIPIPYPTYFHPTKDREVLKWQKMMKKVKRPYLFSFVGAPRPSSTKHLREELINHCLSSSQTCKLLRCYDNGDDKANKCEDTVSVMKVFQSSVFCLQPPGDSFTRRSTFDSILGGCIPVFFHPKSAYDQYLWHLPRNGSKYSVFIPEEDVIGRRTKVNETLMRVSRREVMAKREEVIRIIPRIIYGDPRARFKNTEDAFDIAIKGILERIDKIKREIFNIED